MSERSSVSQTPGSPTLAIFQHHAHGGELVADAVGFGPVFTGTCRQARSNQRFDFSSIHAPFGTGLQEVIGFKLQHAQYAGQFFQTGSQAGRCVQDRSRADG